MANNPFIVVELYTILQYCVNYKYSHEPFFKTLFISDTTGMHYWYHHWSTLNNKNCTHIRFDSYGTVIRKSPQIQSKRCGIYWLVALFSPEGGFFRHGLFCCSIICVFVVTVIHCSAGTNEVILWEFLLQCGPHGFAFSKSDSGKFSTSSCAA